VKPRKAAQKISKGKRQMNDLILGEGGDKKVRLYERMQTAIDECHSIDEFRDVADHASAIAAYYAQIKDKETVRKFLEIQFRAWRRIGEIIDTVDVSGLDTKVAAYRKYRAAFKDCAAVQELSDHQISQAVQIARMPLDFFEREAANGTEHPSLSQLINFYARTQREEWEASPEGQAEAKRNAARGAAFLAEHEKSRREAATKEHEAAAEIGRLKRAHDEALREVGVTLTRQDRANMGEVLLLIKKPIHEALRQAAFDHRVTMQAILRSGLAMWFLAHGYTIPDDLQPLGKRNGGRGPTAPSPDA
jgi:hypothetical protein